MSNQTTMREDGKASDLLIAADARLSPTQITDDQVWRLAIGIDDAPALMLSSGFGGRFGIVSLIPQWVIDGRILYRSLDYAQATTVTDVMPGMCAVDTAITPALLLHHYAIALDSTALGIAYHLKNSGRRPITVTLNLIIFAAANGQELASGTLPTITGSATLSIINPQVTAAITLDGGQIDGESRGRLTRTLTLGAGATILLRCVVVGAMTPQAARAALRAHWGISLSDQIKRHRAHADRTPEIETGDTVFDGAIARAYRAALQSLIAHNATAGDPSLQAVTPRTPDHGFSSAVDGSDQPPAWRGQDPLLAHTIATAIAPLAMRKARALLNAYLMTQRADGWIDAMPGRGGETARFLCPPILAHLCEHLQQVKADRTFLKTAYPQLVAFYKRWRAKDTSPDGVPMWTHEDQTGFPYLPTFAGATPYGQGIAISDVIAPDLIALLLSEARSLKALAARLDTDSAWLDEDIAQLRETLASAWLEDEDGSGRYTYRDRVTGLRTREQVILDHVPAGEHLPAIELTTPSRLLVTLIGGDRRKPNVTFTLVGAAADGSPVQETIPSGRLVWTVGHGTVVSRAVFARIDRVISDGVIPLYKLDVRTPDLDGRDLFGLLPLIAAPDLPAGHAEALLRGLSHPRFWRRYGVSMIAADDLRYDRQRVPIADAVHPFWASRLVEGLLLAGQPDRAIDLARRLLQAMPIAGIAQMHNADTGVALGTSAHIGGVALLGRLGRLWGITIHDRVRVTVEADFAWDAPVTIRQHGVVVTRTNLMTTLEFPSGYVTQVPASAGHQEVTDSG